MFHMKYNDAKPETSMIAIWAPNVAGNTRTQALPILLIAD
jgi:hypothetical protein